MKYVEEISITGGATIGTHVFRANSVFDPNATGTGHQPMLFDQYAAIYSHYTVMKSKITVTPAPPGTTTTNPGYYGVNLATTNTTLSSVFSSVDSLLENPYTTPPKLYGNANTNSGVGLHSLPAVDSMLDAKQFFGVKNITDGSAYSAPVTSNPAQEAFYRIYLAPVSGNTTGDGYFLVEIIYDVHFRDPSSVDGS